MEKLNSQERIFEIIIHLYKNHINGLTNKELSVLVGTSEANICRDLAIFQRYKWIERSQLSGKWRLSPEFSNISGSIAKTYKEALRRLHEDEERYTSGL